MKFKFPPEVQARLDANADYRRERQADARAMTTPTLVAAAQYALRQMPETVRYSAADNVYNGQFYHVLFPEIIKRLGFTEHRFDMPAAANEEEIGFE